MEPTGGTVPSQVISINGQDYSPDEAQELIETGRKTREMEQKWNTKLDNVWPEYGKTRESLKSIEAERDAARRELNEFKIKQQQQVETPADVQAARKAARELGIVLDEDVKGKYISRDELENWYTERRARETSDEEAVKGVLQEADDLQKEINASHPPVQFNKKAVLAYASAFGFTDLREAYEDMNAEVLGPWKEAQIAAKRGASLKTLQPGGAKSPAEVRVTNDNVRELLRETLTRSNE